MHTAHSYFSQLNHDYLAIHQRKETLFWDTYMGISEDHDGFAAAEKHYKQFIACDQRLGELRAHIQRLEQLPPSAERDELLIGLRGWYTFFDCNAIENQQAQVELDQLIELEARLFARRKEFKPHHLDASGKPVEASLGAMLTNLATNDKEAHRLSSHQALLGVEQWVLANGLIDIVQQRNRFARSLGYRNYFDYKVQKSERMTPEQLFTILDRFEAQTRETNLESLSRLREQKGDDATAPHNVRFFSSGDVNRQLDAYMPFASALSRWITSFERLHIGFSGAHLTLDLLERDGKYENGFMHGPVPAFVNEGSWQPATINFTSLAKPDQIGSGLNGLNTLLHEGGHAAHFANIKQNAPCFSQEFAPTSMAYAETQSMFCDSLLDDADWLSLYATDQEGTPIPATLIHQLIAAKQPMRAFGERHILLVPYFEWAFYQLADAEMTPVAITALAREVEQRILGISASPRPTLAIPHLLSQESACSYHGYLLALMAVEQTRAFFLKRDGYLTNNPAIGPDLARHYWQPGNRLTHDETLRSLTGEGFNPDYLAKICNLSVDACWQAAQTSIAAAVARPQTADSFELDAHIRIVHGSQLIADNRHGNGPMCQQFAAWVHAHYPQPE
jgi:oligoendopeptidase F